MDRSYTYRVLGCVYEVYKQLGPGLLESIYEEALIRELRSQGFEVRNQVQVPVYYKDQEGHILASEVVTMTSTAYIYAKDSLVPPSYSRTSAYRTYVTVYNGVANPSSVTFTYKNNATPTPVPQATVIVYYADQGGRILYTDYQTVTSSGYIYAKDALVPGYTRTSSSSAYVSFSGGVATPSSVTFTYKPNATATPLPQVKVTVYYVDEFGALLNSENILMTVSGYVNAKDSMVPAWYTRISSGSSYVTITDGKANPSSVTFQYRNNATPTPAPQVNVTVYYMDTFGALLNTDIVTLTSSGYVYANGNKVPAGYVIQGADSAYVTVTDGKASPSSVTFTYAAPATATPTATPVPKVNVQVVYQDQNGGYLNSTQVTLSVSDYVYADNSMVPAGYELISDSRVYVTVEGGKASPSSVTFTYRNAVTPEPTEEPPETVYVSVVYRDQNGSYLNSTQVAITGGGYVNADNSMVPAGYVLTSSGSVWVSVEHHAPVPAEVVFTYMAPSTPEPTVVPGPTQPPEPGPVGPLNKMGTLSLNGKATNVDWYTDSNGRAMANVFEVLKAMGMGRMNPNYERGGKLNEAVINFGGGHTASVKFSSGLITSFTVDKAEVSPSDNPAIYPVLYEGYPFTPFELFRQVFGFDYQIDGSTLNLIY